MRVAEVDPRPPGYPHPRNSTTCVPAGGTEVPIEMWDERLSTAQAERLMIDGGVRREKRRGKIDKVAAALILQSYLDANP